MRPVKILIDCAKSQADLNFRWAHMSKGRFSEVAAYLHSRMCQSVDFVPACTKRRSSRVYVCWMRGNLRI